MQDNSHAIAKHDKKQHDQILLHVKKQSSTWWVSLFICILQSRPILLTQFILSYLNCFCLSSFPRVTYILFTVPFHDLWHYSQWFACGACLEFSTPCPPQSGLHFPLYHHLKSPFTFINVGTLTLIVFLCYKIMQAYHEINTTNSVNITNQVLINCSWP